MSRFTNYSPKAERIAVISSNTAAEDEIIQSILRKRQQRISSGRLPEASTNFDASTGSTTSNDSVQRPAAEFSTPSRKDESPNPKTPYSRLRRLARTNTADPRKQLSTMEESLEEQARAIYASSVTSHTTASIEEAVAVLAQNTSQNTSFKQERLQQTTPIDLHRDPPAAKDLSPIQLASDSMTIALRSHARPNRTLFTPDNVRERPLSQEVAQGYRSPPASNRTSPKTTSSNKLISPFGTPHKLLHRSLSLETSPTPIEVQRTPMSTSNVLPGDSQARQAPRSCPSPRSRLARTLLEIQSELADSREGIEAIEVRLDILEKQAPLDRNLLSKHVEDCIRDMAQVLEDSMDNTIDNDSIEDLQLPPAEIPMGQDTAQLIEREAPNSGIRIPWTGKAIFYGILGTIVAEWLIMAAMDEYGRRQGFMAS